MSLSEKQKRFAAEYLIDLNATQAAIRAGYAKNSAKVQGSRLLSNDNVQAEIQRQREGIQERTEINQDWVIEKWAALVGADPNELTSIEVGACRHCHGEDHEFQWRTEDEFDRAFEAYWELPDAKRAKAVPPVVSGGFGYSPRLAPHPDCPRCDGHGQQNVRFKDTTNLSEGAKMLFAGVKTTQNGIEVKMHSQADALLSIAKHLGMFPSKVELTGKAGGPVQTITAEMTPQQAREAYEASLNSDEG